MQGTLRARLGVTFVVVGLVLVGLAVWGPAAQAANSSLAGWTQRGTNSAAWQVAGDGLSVNQSLNGTPSFFVSPNTLTSGSFTVDITPETSADDDFIGIVLGYSTPALNDTTCNTANCPNNYLLLDWKRSAEPDGADEGMNVIRVNGNFDIRTTNTNLACFWKHVDDNAACNILATNTGAGTGWIPAVVNRLKVTYSAQHIKVEKVTNQASSTVFDFDGNFPSGQFGFYNYQQTNTTYTISGVVINGAGGPTTTTSAPVVTTTTAAPTQLPTVVNASGATTTIAKRSRLARTGQSTAQTAGALAAGATLIGLGALMVAARGRRAQGSYFAK